MKIFFQDKFLSSKSFQMIGEKSKKINQIFSRFLSCTSIHFFIEQNVTN